MRIPEEQIPFHFRPMNDIRGLTLLELKDLGMIQRAIGEKHIISTPLDAPMFPS
jgi:hypothetical protein